MKYSPGVEKRLCLNSEFLHDVLLPSKNFRRDFLEGLNETCCRKNILEEEVRLQINFLVEVNQLENALKMKRSRFVKALRKYCPCPRNLSRRNMRCLLAMGVPHYKVFALLRVVSLDLLLPRMVGGRANLQKIIASLRQLVGLSGRGVFRVGHVLEKLQIPNENMRVYLTAFLRAFFRLMMQVLRTFFYVTSMSPETVVYFRNPVWREILRKQIFSFQQEGFLRPVARTRALSSVLSGQCLGLSRLRLALKPGSRLRPILVLSQRALVGSHRLPSINSRLAPLLEFFRDIRQKCSFAKAARAASMEELFVKLKHYRERKEKEGITGFHLVKGDVQNFYCHIHTPYLLQELDRMFQMAAMCYPEWSREKATEKKELLEKFLFHQYARVGSSFFRLLRGVPQGANIAPYLGNLYLRRLDRELRLQSCEDLLLRMVDDLLFVTPSLGRATDFLTNLKSGLARLHLILNESKVQQSFRGERITFLGFELLPSLEPAIQPLRRELTESCKFSGDQLDAAGVLRRIALFVPNLKFYKFAVIFAHSRERQRANRVALARAFAQHVLVLVKSSPDRTALTGALATQLAAAINSRLFRIGTNDDLHCRRECRVEFLRGLRPFRGQFFSVLRILKTSRFEEELFAPDSVTLCDKN